VLLSSSRNPTGRHRADPAAPADPVEPEARSEPAAGPGSGRALRARAFWSFADQALSSATNAGLSIVVARSVGPGSFGAFSLALVTFSFVIGVGRAVVADVFVIRFSGAEASVAAEAARRATGGAVVLGVLGGVFCGVAGLLVPDGQTRAALLALGLALPGLLVQDCFRFVFFAAGRPDAATVNDLVWAVVQFTLIGLLIGTGRDSIFWITLAWGFAALVAAGLACRQAGVRPAPGLAGGWLADNRGLNVRMGLDYVVNMGAFNLATYLVGAIVGLLGVGALRAAQVLLGPLQLVSSGAAAFVLPVFSARAGTGRSLLRPATAVSAGVTAVAGLWVGALLLVPAAWGRAVLGGSWAGARSVLLASGLTMIVIALTTGPSLALRALRRADLLLRVTLVQSPLLLLLGAGGAWIGGVTGAATGFALAQSVGAVAIWTLLLRADTSPRSLRPSS
jgi:O-antigen/teichoic acid export membrane protein